MFTTEAQIFNFRTAAELFVSYASLLPAASRGPGVGSRSLVGRMVLAWYSRLVLISEIVNSGMDTCPPLKRQTLIDVRNNEIHVGHAVTFLLLPRNRNPHVNFTCTAGRLTAHCLNKRGTAAHRNSITLQPKAFQMYPCSQICSYSLK